MKRETLDKVYTLIYRATDEGMKEILEAYNNRRRQLYDARERQALSSIKIGDTVRVINGKPRYLIGTRAEVIGRQGRNFRIRLALNCDPRALRRFGPQPLCPATMLQKVD